MIEKKNTFHPLSTDLAVNLQSQKRDLEAEMTFRRSIEVRKEDKEREGNPTYMMTLHSLAELYGAQGVMKMADTLLKKVTALRRAKYVSPCP